MKEELLTAFLIFAFGALNVLQTQYQKRLDKKQANMLSDSLTNGWQTTAREAQQTVAERMRSLEREMRAVRADMDALHDSLDKRES